MSLKLATFFQFFLTKLAFKRSIEKPKCILNSHVSMSLKLSIFFQFFPCKICGAKFPSYYFVHKHKKMWHNDEDDSESKSPEVTK